MTEAGRSPLPARRAYAEWAPRYDAENVVTTLERITARDLGPPVGGLRLLDVGCGTGRRLPSLAQDRPTLIVGLDVVTAMLRQYRGAAPLINADILRLPVAPGAFDAVWCRLVLGHVSDLDAAYSELRRTLDDRAWLLVTDFHPNAARSGHRRTFEDETGGSHSIAFHSHEVAAHVDAARGAGLRLDGRRDACVGPVVRPLYEQAGRLEAYDAQVGLELVFGLLFRVAR
jgi:malonyl-CoA O-methyltransferase